ncbi:hypothetical protein CDD83_4649 [Cordyceps sp. RAO-2017]|nr:hypothetical protein CDD83_4649 [Cordyceps sp. RAO-2017]
MTTAATKAAATAATTTMATAAPPGVDSSAGYNRSACTECQRRKQKCNREWPCDRCQRRKIADECRYNNVSSTNGNPVSHPDPTSVSLSQPAAIQAHENALEDEPRTALATRAEAKPSDDTPSFDALAAARLFTTLGIDSKEDFAAADSSPQMKRVLELLPQRQIMDKLINSFVHEINYYYYTIYPPDFLRDYHIWWERRNKEKPITLQYTSLLAMICANSIQHAEKNMQRELEQASVLEFEEWSEQLHCAVRELASVIPVGHYHMFGMQRLLQSCYWYKAEGRFFEAWHILSAAILEAKELGYHREPPEGTETDHEREMRRRIWCIIYTWDWQISSGLSRPILIRHGDSNTKPPSLTLERYPNNPPNPLLHMKLQAALIEQLAARFQAPKNVITPPEVREYQAMIEGWVSNFLPVFHWENPDTSKDKQFPWILPQRYYLYTMACLMILNPIRHYMVRSHTAELPAEELSLRETGVSYSLKLLEVLRDWVGRIYNRDGRMHFIVFSIFDTAAILCTALIKDTEHTLTERAEIYRAVRDAVSMLQRLNSISRTSRTSYGLLNRLVQRLPPLTAPRQINARKKTKTAGGPATAVDATPMPRPVPAGGAANPPAANPAASMSATSMPPANPPAVSMPPANPPPANPPALNLPSANPAAEPPVANSPPSMCGAAGYGRQLDLASVPGPVLRSNFVAPEGPAMMRTSVPADVVNDAQAYYDKPACPENKALSGAERILASFSVMDPPIGLPVVQMFRHPEAEMGNFPPPLADDELPGFELETVTQAELGHVAPLWAWHSENLNFAAGIGEVAAPVFVRHGPM